ncbi:MAG: hypothetical protein ACRDJN_21010 [Chloroflexota bacterium]
MEQARRHLTKAQQELAKAEVAADRQARLAWVQARSPELFTALAQARRDLEDTVRPKPGYTADGLVVYRLQQRIQQLETQLTAASRSAEYPGSV